ncbi:MAG TPA: permease [Cyclobacteriaceae bacterium]|nr:permease [Cyclobacteriaceae bacterium]
MSSALTKTVYLILIIFIGYLFNKKIHSKDQKDGIKILILGLALPATIFIALLKIEFSIEMIIVPALALGFNLMFYFFMHKLPLRNLFNIPEHQYRTLILLIPSLAPGLSCFPFIAEFSGDEPLALAALADVGNKLFVLMIAYTIAMKWFYTRNKIENQTRSSKIKDLLLAMAEEPVNMAIVVAIVMLALGLNFSSLPEFIQMSIDKLSLMMTPLVLLFIGISVKLTRQQVKTITSMLFLRSGFAFLFSAVLLFLLPVKDIGTRLLIVVFIQSACSFWPYAHMVAVGRLEDKNNKQGNGTFDLDFAMNLLACSLPFSVTLILIIYSSGDFFTHTYTIFGSSLMFIVLSAVPLLLTQKRSMESMESLANR